MKRIKRKAGALAIVIATTGVMALGQAPAFASTQVSGSCTDVYVHQNTLSGSAWYTTPSAGLHHWTGTSFRADGALENGNDIFIGLYQGGREVVRREADNIAGNYSYTSTAHPKFALNTDTASVYKDEHVGFWMKFDVPWPADDDLFWCSFTTPNI